MSQILDHFLGILGFSSARLTTKLEDILISQSGNTTYSYIVNRNNITVHARAQN